MKKQKEIKSWHIILLILATLPLSGFSCPPPIDPYSGYIFGFFSYPTIYITDGGSNFSNPFNPVTGTNVTNATVTVSNETTGVYAAAPYVSSSPRGYYQPAANFSHNPGERVSLTVKTTNETITGSSTITPNPVYSNLSPASGATAALPFTVSWDVAQGAYGASHTWVKIYDAGGSTAEAKNYQVVVPVSQKSVSITSSNIQAGSYAIVVFGVNTMTITGAKPASIVYVDGGGTAAFSTNVTVP